MAESYLFELKRKLFHFCGIIFPIIYYFLPTKTMTITLIIVTSIVVTIDIAKKFNKKIQTLFIHIFTPIMRHKELTFKTVLTGASYMVIGFMITCILYPKSIVIVSWFVLIISDSCAALAGKKLGRMIHGYGKSLFGSTIFLLSSFFICAIVNSYMFNNLCIYNLSISCVITTILEFFSKKMPIDDNLLIPISFSTISTLLSLC